MTYPVVEAQPDHYAATLVEALELLEFGSLGQESTERVAIAIRRVLGLCQTSGCEFRAVRIPETETTCPSDEWCYTCLLEWAD